MKLPSTLLISAASTLVMPLTLAHAGEAQSLEQNTTVTTTVTDDSATHTRVWEKRLGTVNSSVSGAVVQNDDGSVTYQKDRIVTSQEGESVTKSKTVNVGRDEDGNLNVDRGTELEGSGGRSYIREQQNELVRNEDGSGSFSRNGNAAVTGADGETRTAQSNRQSAWQHNDDGGRDYAHTRNASTSEGRTVTGKTTARTTRDGSGNGTFESVRDLSSNSRVERR